MPAAPIPENEPARLAALSAQALLDTPADPRFDGIVRLAADLFEAPIALVSLVDENRQWFKSVVGLDVCQTPRDQAFCAYAILSPDEMMVVEDAAADPRVADNPLVLGDPFIRFYAGAPLLADGGEALGTLCVIDRRPRAFSVRDRERLRALADSVSGLISLHRHASVLNNAAHTDALTGLPNRAAFEARLGDAVAAGAPFALLLMDLDGFKRVNDTHGHAAGDAVLAETARRLRGAARPEDFVARLGGDEFALLTGGAMDIRMLGERLVGALAQSEVAVGVSVGAALYPADASDACALLGAADRALYVAKAAGGGRLVHAGALRTKAA